MFLLHTYNKSNSAKEYCSSRIREKNQRSDEKIDHLVIILNPSST